MYGTCSGIEPWTEDGTDGIDGVPAANWENATALDTLGMYVAIYLWVSRVAGLHEPSKRSGSFDAFILSHISAKPDKCLVRACYEPAEDCPLQYQASTDT